MTDVIDEVSLFLDKRIYPYLKENDEDLFRVSLYDTNINQEQIMLRNKAGVYVLTPSLNQAYNFKSGWPLNSAKPYIYQSLLDVFSGDYEIEKLDDGFVVVSNIEFKNSPAYSKQEIKFSKDLVPLWVNLYNDKDEVLVKVTFTKVEIGVGFQENYFEVDKNMLSARENLVSGGEKEEIEFGDNINIIYGNNAQGKTNLLESIYVLGLTKSHRSFIDNSLINNESEYLTIEGIINDKKALIEQQTEVDTDDGE